MSPESTENCGKSEIRIQPQSGLHQRRNDSISTLGEIVNQSLIYLKTSKHLTTQHRIGDYKLFDPDYRLVCAMAEDLCLSTDETLHQLLLTKDNPSSFSTRIVNGRFRSIHIYKEILPISSIPIINGLTIEFARINLKGMLSSSSFLTFPELKELHCENNELDALDISSLAKLEILNCSSNNLHELNISKLKNLSSIQCDGNKLSSLDLSHFEKLEAIACTRNRLNELNFIRSGNLRLLCCKDNNLTNLDVSNAYKLDLIWCDVNNISMLNIFNIINLRTLICDSAVRLIKRPDQNF
jgi:hypothetical protein